MTDGKEPGSEEHRIEELAEQHPGAFPIIASLAVVALLVAMVLLIQPLRDAVGSALSGDTEALRDDMDGLGGIVLVLALAVAHSVVWYPAEILNAAAGFVYGFWFALPLVMVGWILNGIFCHQVGRHAARPALVKVLGADRFLTYERAIARGGVTLLLLVRLIPIVPFSFFSYVAGSARVPLWTFVWTTTIGYIPLTALFVWFGSRLEELSLSDPAIWIGVAALVALVLLSRWVVPMLGVGKDTE